MEPPSERPARQQGQPLDPEQRERWDDGHDDGEDHHVSAMRTPDRKVVRILAENVKERLRDGEGPERSEMRTTLEKLPPTQSRASSDVDRRAPSRMKARHAAEASWRANTYSSGGIGRLWRSRSAIGWKKVCAIAVGISAEATTTVISSENWVLSMMPAPRPNSAEIVPNVSPVLISSVAKVAWRGMWRRASGSTKPSFGTIFAASSTARMPKLAKTAPRETLRPPRMKKKGVRKANATTRIRSCSVRCWAKCRLIARPRTNAGSTAWPFEASASTIRPKRHTKTSLISGSITRSP